jgi:hypothetical protein
MARKVSVLATLPVDDYHRLVDRAREEDRRVDQQASHLLRQALRGLAQKETDVSLTAAETHR